MIKIENRIGDNTQPSLNPVVTWYDLDSVLPTLTLAEVLEYISWHILRNFPPNPSFVIFVQSPSLHTTGMPFLDLERPDDDDDDDGFWIWILLAIAFASAGPKNKTPKQPQHN